jgi:hypothetical protein
MECSRTFSASLRKILQGFFHRAPIKLRKPLFERSLKKHDPPADALEGYRPPFHHAPSFLFVKSQKRGGAAYV